MTQRKIRPFSDFNSEKYRQQQLQEEATDWWSCVDEILSSLGKVVNFVKSKLSENEIQTLRSIYAELKAAYISNKERNDYAEAKKEKDILRKFLKVLNDAQPRTNQYVGVYKTTPRGVYHNKWGARWRNHYKIIYGKERGYGNDNF